MGTSGLVFDIEKFAVHDGPGIRTVVFLKGCALRCVWCHSPESQGRQPELAFYANLCMRCGTCVQVCKLGAQDLVGITRTINRDLCNDSGDCAETCPTRALEMKGSWWTVEEVVREVAKDETFYRSSGGGVTVSGGEPTLQPTFLRELLQALKARGIHTAIETCGLANPGVLAEIEPLVDIFLYDVKHMDPVVHERLTGVSNQRILENLTYLARRGRAVQVRVPVIPGHNDSMDNLARLGDFMRGVGLKRIALLPYNPSAGAKYDWLDQQYALEGLKPQTAEEMKRLATVLVARGLEVQIGA